MATKIFAGKKINGRFLSYQYWHEPQIYKHETSDVIEKIFVIFCIYIYICFLHIIL